MRRDRPATSRGQRLAIAVILVVGAAVVLGLRARAPSERAGTVPTSPATVSAADGHYQLVQLPQDGMGAVYGALAAARRSVEVEIYEFADPVMTAFLVAARHRRVAVRVLLSRAYRSGQVNAATFDTLRAHGISVRWAPARVIFHIQAIVVDRAIAIVSTGNFVTASYRHARDAVVLDRSAAQVAAIDHTLGTDWGDTSGVGPATASPGLLWSPAALEPMRSEIASARASIFYSSEELADADVYGALAAAARRGVACYVVMTYARTWTHAFRALRDAGCHVHVGGTAENDTYFHIKRIIVDAGRPAASILLGSQNASYTSLTANRELSVRLTFAQAPHVIAAVARTFQADYQHTSAWPP